MKAADFERRPIAGLAGRIDLLGTARPGQVLELAADIESLDAEAVAYRGVATIDGALVIRLEDCMGPMIPATDLDDPAAVRERFTLLCGPGAAPDGCRELPALSFQRIDGEPGQCARATFQVSASPPAAFPARSAMTPSMGTSELAAR